MKHQSDFVEIEFVDIKEDPNDDSVLLVSAEIRGPGTRFEIFCVYFTEKFFSEFFGIRWFQDFTRIQHRLVEKKEDFFVKLALIRVERFLNGFDKNTKVVLNEGDVIWAEKVDEGKILPASKEMRKNVFLFLPHGTVRKQN
ncbi:MAG TPA: hypothetical protein PKL97_00530 [Candidatus Omnitrophota bacterium]|nr:hypothetical protein [Candidatus Omnitrophota bacterium]